GVVRDSAESIERFSTSTGYALPILRDPGSIAASYEVGENMVVVLMDARHVVRFRLDGFSGRFFRERLAAVAAALRKLPAQGPETAPEMAIDYTEHPRAPVFQARDIDGRSVDLAALRGHVVVLDFFDQECPHCLLDLPRLVPVLREQRARGVRAIGVASR